MRPPLLEILHLAFVRTRRRCARGFLEPRLERAARTGNAAGLEALLERSGWPAGQALTPRALWPWEWPHRQNRGHTLLHVAAAHGQVDAIAVLVKRGAAVDAATHWGMTPALTAAVNGHAPAVALLARHGADMGRLMPDPCTTLHDFDLSGPAVPKVLEQATGKPYRGDEYACVVAGRLDSALEPGCPEGAGGRVRL